MSKVGYIRSANGHDDAVRQEEAMSQYVEAIFRDIVPEHGSGNPELNRMMAILKEGDSLFVPSLSTLSRSVRDVLQLLDLLGQKKIAFTSLEEGFDTETAEGKSTLKVLNSLIALDKSSMDEWKKDYIESAKKRARKASNRAVR